jgi:glyoxylate reductase
LTGVRSFLKALVGNVNRVGRDNRMRILVTFEVLPSVRALIEARANAIFVAEDAVRQPEMLAAASKGCDAIMPTVTHNIDAAAISAVGDTVRAIATYSVGFEHIDLSSARRRAITILNTPGVLTDAVAEVAMLLMLGAARRATESIALIRSRLWQGWTPIQLPGVQLVSKRLGIFGMGRIGKAVAVRAAAFGLEIHTLENRSSEASVLPEVKLHSTVDDLLSHSEVLLLACPATRETTGFLNARRIELLPQGALVVNVARGTVVEDEALIAALSSGRIAAAGLDVFANEPAFDSRYLDLPNAFLLPHIGSSTIEARERMATILLDGLEILFAGGHPSNIVL